MPWPDPQSGPRRGKIGHFHFSLAWVRGVDGAIASLRLATYMDRAGTSNKARDRPLKEPLWPMGGHSLVGMGSTQNLHHYVDREGRFRSTGPEELGGSVLITRGLKVASGQQLARALDAKERKKDRTYRRYGGKLPRVSAHLIASFSYGLTPDEAHEILCTFGSALSDRLGVPLYGRIHNKNGQPDHMHMMIGTRVVRRGKLAEKARSLDAVSEKIAGKGIDVGEGKLVGQTCEWMRGEWARLLREASLDLTIDHRSYARRGLNIIPVTYVSRSQIEWEKRRNSTAWRDRRDHELKLREASDPVRRDDQICEAAPETKRDERKERVDRDRPSTTPQKRARKLLDAFIKPLSARVDVCDPAQNTLSEIIGIDIPVEIVQAALRRRHAQSLASDGNTRALHAASSHEAGRNRGADIAPTKSERTVHATGASNEAAPQPPRHSHGIEVAIDLFRLLKHSHRLNRERSTQLAESVGMTRITFEAEAIRVIEVNVGRPQIEATPAALPPILWDLWEKWRAEDNAVRRGRRADQRASSEEETSDLVGGTVTLPDTGATSISSQLRVNVSHDAHGAREGRAAAHSVVQRSGTAKGTNADGERPASQNAIGPRAALPGLHRSTSLEDTVAASRLLDRTLYSAFVADIQLTYERRGKPVPIGPQLDRAMAISLRATGRDAEEVASVMRAGSSVTDQSSINQSIHHAFSLDGQRKLTTRPSFVKHAQWIERRIESQVYRELKRNALNTLRDDLDEVWIKRKMEAEEAHRRHTARLAVLNDIRWRTRRLRRRGLVPFMLSLMVELAILRPIMARLNAIGAAERTAINNRAAWVSTELKRYRTNWQSLSLEEARDILRGYDGSSRDPRSIKSSFAGSENRVEIPARAADLSSQPKTAADHWRAAERRDVVADVALVLIARGLWTEDIGNDLAGVVHEERNLIRDLAYKRCREIFDQRDPEKLKFEETARLWKDSLKKAKFQHWDELENHMRKLRSLQRKSDLGISDT